MTKKHGITIAQDTGQEHKMRFGSVLEICSQLQLLCVCNVNQTLQ